MIDPISKHTTKKSHLPYCYISKLKQVTKLKIYISYVFPISTKEFSYSMTSYLKISKLHVPKMLQQIMSLLCKVSRGKGVHLLLQIAARKRGRGIP